MYTVGRVTGYCEMTAQTSNDYRSSISESDLSNLGPGCYVKIQDSGKSYWTEIVKVDGKRITAIVHPELSENGRCETCYSAGTAVAYGREHIIGLGCDNYCWC